MLLVGLLLVTLALSLFPCVVQAQGGDLPDPDDPGNGDDDGSDNVITHIFKLIFPIETMQAATEILLSNMLLKNAEGASLFFARIAAGMTLLNPGIKTSACYGIGVWRNVEGPGGIFVPTWNFVVKIAVALWPATLAIMAAAAAQESAISTDWGISSLKQALAEWLGGVLFCAFSLELLDLVNRLSNAVIVGIIDLPFGGEVNLQAIVNWILMAPLQGSNGVSVIAAILILLVELVFGIALIFSLFGQLFARGALLYIIVAISPLVLVVSILRPARWLRWLWIKGLLLVMLLGPITALLLKLTAALHSVLVDRNILDFAMIVGVISVLLTINGAIIQGMFGAAAATVGKAVTTAQGIAQEIGGDAKEIGLGVGEALLGHDLRQFQPGILSQVLGQCSAAAEAGQMGYQPLAVMDIALQTGIGNLVVVVVVVVAHECVPPGGGTNLTQMRTLRNCRRFAAIDADQPSSGSCRLTGRPFSCRRHCAAGCGRA